MINERDNIDKYKFLKPYLKSSKSVHCSKSYRCESVYMCITYMHI